MDATASAVALVDLAPLARLMLLAALVAMLPLAFVWLRRRGGDTRMRLAALTAVTLFLTFDLIVFGAFTRLSDSGLGCPDWPGCYGSASPLGARDEIHAAQSAMPSGPVTWSKAWIEMIHRYLAMTVGVLILVMAAVSWVERRRLPVSPWWATATLAWVIVQGLFGKYTVTLKLYPAIVTLHLLGGLALLALLVIQHAAWRGQALALPPVLRRAVPAVLLLVAVQAALGGWVSTNYAVLACSDFPTCQGRWWPAVAAADWVRAFEPLRELGHAADGTLLGFGSLVAIHWVHRLFAVVVTLAGAWLAWGLAGVGGAARRFGIGLAAVLALQVASGLSNVVLGWPLLAALFHSAGAAALVALLTSMWARSRAMGWRAAAAAADRPRLPVDGRLNSTP